MSIEFIYKNDFLTNSEKLPNKAAFREIFGHSSVYWREAMKHRGNQTDKDYICEIFEEYGVFADMFSGDLKFYLHTAPFSLAKISEPIKIPIIEVENEDDFALLIQKLVFKERPVPHSMGAAIIKNYQRNFIKHSIIVLSKKYYSGVQPEVIGLSAEIWREKSLELRREHEISHFMTQYFYGISKQAIHDEIIADFMGITATFREYRPEYLLMFWGLENYPRYRQGGRLENYLPGNYPENEKQNFSSLCGTVKSAVENIYELYEKLNKDSRRTFRVLCETTIEDMAAGKFADIVKIEFEEFYEEYFPKIYNYIYFRVSNFAVTGDLTSDTFYKAYLYFDKYNANLGSQYTWLCAIARNVVNAYFSKLSKVSFADEFDENAVSGENTETGIEERELMNELSRLIFKFPEKHRELIAMKYILGKTNREIAKEKGMSESNVGTTLNRIVEKLRKKLKDYV